MRNWYEPELSRYQDKLAVPISKDKYKILEELKEEEGYEDLSEMVDHIVEFYHKTSEAMKSAAKIAKEFE